MTDKPFGVNLTVFPNIRHVDHAGYARVCVEAGIETVETAGSAAVRDVWKYLKMHG